MTRWFHPEFAEDLITAARYYQTRRPPLGGEFLDEAEAGVEEIMRAPQRWPTRIGGVRRFLLSRFPYAIRYRLVGDHVEILSILHCARHPDAGAERTAMVD